MCMHILHFLYPFIGCWAPRLTPLLAVVNSAVMNMGMQISLLHVDLYSFGYMSNKYDICLYCLLQSSQCPHGGLKIQTLSKHLLTLTARIQQVEPVCDTCSIHLRIVYLVGSQVSSSETTLTMPYCPIAFLKWMSLSIVLSLECYIIFVLTQFPPQCYLSVPD
jgi:hypothetical protein